MTRLALLFVAGLLASSWSLLAGEDRACLVVYPTAKYALPSGETVSVQGSKTSGLQEAIDRAVKDGFDLYVSGGDYKSKVYQCSTSVVFPPMQGKVLKFGAATINLDGFADPSQPGLVFDSCMNVFVECNAQIVYHHKGTALRFEPRRNLPVDDFVGPTMVASTFHFAAVAYVSTPVSFVGKDGGIPRTDTNACCVVMSPTKSISRCEFKFIELLGGNFGLRVNTPASGSCFAFNRIDCSFVHEQFNTSIAEGSADGSTWNGSIRGNQWNVHCAPGANACAVDVRGNHGRWIINVVAEKGPLGCGLATHSTTTDNTFVLQNLDGKTSGQFSKKEPGSNRFE
jgi:hypothetical protein